MSVLKVIVLLTVAGGLSLIRAQKQVELRIPGDTGTVSARGYIGGESHDRYAVVLPAERTLTVSISSKKNQADFIVSESADFSEATPASFGKEASQRRSWSGIVPKPGTYYIYVTAHPVAHYRLEVKLR